MTEPYYEELRQYEIILHTDEMLSMDETYWTSVPLYYIGAEYNSKRHRMVRRLRDDT
jgi:hypothetical protein